MTQQQADWAAEHDWFRNFSTNYATGDITVHCRAYLNDNPDLPSFIKRFTDLSELEAWAGY